MVVTTLMNVSVTPKTQHHPNSRTISCDAISSAANPMPVVSEVNAQAKPTS